MMKHRLALITALTALSLGFASSAFSMGSDSTTPAKKADDYKKAVDLIDDEKYSAAIPLLQKSIKEKVEYYMRLNGAGRGSLITKGTANRAEWVEMLISCSDDLDCLFYFTSMNPTLCQYANAQTTDVIITHEIKQVRRHTLHTCGPVLTTDEPKAAGRRASVF